LLLKKPPRSLGDRLFRLARNAIARLGLVRPHVTRYLWLPALKHVQSNGDRRTLLIWALGVGREELRLACEDFARHLDDTSGLVPVLVTDVADFAHYSRLKWLVEYVPELSGAGPSYRERKQRYLAWRYRDALAVPVSAGNATTGEWHELMGIKG
jgi:hypothetical protein